MMFRELTEPECDREWVRRGRRSRSVGRPEEEEQVVVMVVMMMMMIIVMAMVMTTKSRTAMI